MAERVVDHQMAVECAAALVHERRDRLQHDRADRHGLDEMSVADVEVEDTHTGVQERLDLLAEPCEVGGVDRRLELEVAPDHVVIVSRATKKPLVPWTCGSVSRNSGRRGCANCGHSAPSGSTRRPLASTIASFSSALIVQTE